MGIQSRIVSLTFLFATASCTNLSSLTLAHNQRSNADLEQMWADQSSREYDHRHQQNYKSEHLNK